MPTDWKMPPGTPPLCLKCFKRPAMPGDRYMCAKCENRLSLAEFRGVLLVGAAGSVWLVWLVLKLLTKLVHP